MMKRIKSVFSILFCILFIGAFVDMPVYAEGTTMIYLSEKDLGVGDTLTMTVNGSEKSTITVRYNASVLNFSNCDASGYTTNGNAITFTGKSAKITFKAASQGTSNLIVASDTLTGASTAVNVSGSGGGNTSSDSNSDNSSSESNAATEAEPSESETSEEAEQPADDPNAASGDFSYEGVAYVISERFSEKEMPAGFTKSALEIHGKTYNEPTSDAMTLLYLKPEANTEGTGTFFVYDTAGDTVSPMQLLGDLEHYVILMQPDEFFAQGLIDAEITVQDVTCRAYQMNGVQNDFYFVYGTNESQATGWYQYDAAQGTLQRVNTDLISLSGQESQGTDGTEGTDGNTDDGAASTEEDKEPLVDKLIEQFGDVRLILAVMIFALAVLIIIIIYILVFRKDEDEDVFIGADDDDSDINLIGSDADGLLDAGEVGIEEDQASAVVEEHEAAPERRGLRKAQKRDEDDEADDLDDEDGHEEKKPPKKRKLFFTKNRQDDIWSEPEDDSSSIFDNDDEYEKFFQRVRNNAKETKPDDGTLDVIDLNEL